MRVKKKDLKSVNSMAVIGFNLRVMICLPKVSSRVYEMSARLTNINTDTN